MRTLLTVLCLSVIPLGAAAQDLPDDPVAPDDDEALEADGYVALSADQRAQMSFDGFRSYLERIHDEDDGLYQLLDPRLDALEERNTIADVVFWTGTALAVGALVSAIPVHEELGLDPSLAFIFAGVGTFALAVIIQAIVRPGHSDLMQLIDLHDQRLGRR
ncbi:MAG: hypothetical protein KC619_27540 [Myxococcales bacterium]|nr:hypothetical protein [Myxococcales bacterium]